MIRPEVASRVGGFIATAFMCVFSYVVSTFLTIGMAGKWAGWKHVLVPDGPVEWARWGQGFWVGALFLATMEFVRALVRLRRKQGQERE